MVKELDKILIKIEALDVDPQPIPTRSQEDLWFYVSWRCPLKSQFLAGKKMFGKDTKQVDESE